ncbi:MAG TPA: thioredoxin [Proteobacteria bacterium]|mgnify:CR=1 FL=1|nr:thioredoxin [Pseudomonadota bacterium]
MSDNVTQVTDESFAELLKDSELPILIDFFATWCGPCTAIAPILDEFAGENQDKLKVVKLNVDENPKTPAKYGVRGIPTLILFKQGKEIDKVVGMTSKNNLEKMIAAI